MVLEDKLVVKINVEASTYGDPNQITKQEIIFQIPVTLLFVSDSLKW